MNEYDYSSKHTMFMQLETHELGSVHGGKNKRWPMSSAFDILETGFPRDVFVVFRWSFNPISSGSFSGVFWVFGEPRIIKTT